MNNEHAPWCEYLWYPGHPCRCQGRVTVEARNRPRPEDVASTHYHNSLCWVVMLDGQEQGQYWDRPEANAADDALLDVLAPVE